MERFPQPTYVLMQNGLNVEVDLYNALKTAGIDNPKILSTAVWIGTNLLAPNVVQHNNFVSTFRYFARTRRSQIETYQDRVTLGVYRHKDRTTQMNTPEELTLLQDFGSILEAGGTTLTIVPEIQRMKFAKNIWNVVFASFATLTKWVSFFFFVALLILLKWFQQHSPGNIPSAS
jgi:2-dehydropantoate 2-reductase